MSKTSINFSEKTLVSFGDSYTFGHGVTLESDSVLQEGITNSFTPHILQKWRKLCNDFSYTKFVQDRLGFKDNHNLGYPGASNKRILQMVMSYSNSNDLSDKFFMVSLTKPDRDLIYTYSNTKNGYVPYDFLFNVWAKDNNGTEYDVYKMKRNSVLDNITYYNNDYTILMNQIFLHYNLVNYLDTLNVPYVILDVLNDTTAWKDRGQIDDLIESDKCHRHFYDSEEFNMDVDVIKNYFDDLENSNYPTYLNYYSLKNYAHHLNTDEFKFTGILPNLEVYARCYPTKKSVRSPVKDDHHLGVHGHKILSIAIEDWIRKHYE